MLVTPRVLRLQGNTMNGGGDGWRPYDGYIHVPGIWVDERPIDPARIAWPRMLEIVCERSLRMGMWVIATRECMFSFRFAGSPLGGGNYDPDRPDAKLLEPRIVRLLHDRADALTFHSACLAQARGEASDSYGHRATLLTPANMVRFDRGPLGNPVAAGRGIRAALALRTADKLREPIALGLQRWEEGSSWIDLITLERSFELFDNYYDGPGGAVVRIVSMIVAAADHLDRNEFDQSFFLAFAVLEQLIARRWEKLLETQNQTELGAEVARLVARAGKRADKMSLAECLAVLKQADAGSDDWSHADHTRRLRNHLIHELAQVESENTQEIVQLTMRLLKAVIGLDLRLSVSYGYVL
jgi:hypothetical protein